MAGIRRAWPGPGPTKPTDINNSGGGKTGNQKNLYDKRRTGKRFWVRQRELWGHSSTGPALDPCPGTVPGPTVSCESQWGTPFSPGWLEAAKVGKGGRRARNMTAAGGLCPPAPPEPPRSANRQTTSKITTSKNNSRSNMYALSIAY